jgi:hypothetical protein
MALARVKVWGVEVLTPIDLNTEFNNIIAYLNQLAGSTYGGTFKAANTGLQALDPDGSNYLTFVPGSNLTANRSLTFLTGDADRTLTLNGDLNIGPSLRGLLPNVVPGAHTFIPGVVAASLSGATDSRGWIVYAGSPGDGSGVCLAVDNDGALFPILQAGSAANPISFFGGGTLSLAHSYGANAAISWNAIKIAP